MRLEGKVAMVTGGGNGMGAEECRLFAREGARVAIADIREEDGKRVEAEIAEAGGDAMFVNLNVADEDSWIAAVEQVVGRYGKLDVLVNNAGISGSGERDFRSTDAWDRLLDINARGVFLGTKHAVTEMQKIGGGSIVNISSISGIVGQESVHPGYNASKGAVRLLTKATAVQHAKDGIRINSVHPGHDAAHAHLLPARRRPPGEADQRRADAAARARPSRSPTPSCSWPQTKPPTSPAPNWWSTAASPPGRLVPTSRGRLRV